MKIALTSGRIQTNVAELLEKAGLRLDFGSNGRNLRPTAKGDESMEFAVVRSKDAASLLKQGSFDAAFLGEDMLAEVRAGDAVKTLLNTEQDRVDLVLAVRDVDRDRTIAALESGGSAPLRIATKYPNLVSDWLESRTPRFPATVVPVEGSVEVYAHILEGGIVDVMASGETLRSNGLTPVATLRASSTVLAANVSRLSDPAVGKALDDLTFALRGVIEGAKREELSVNVTLEREQAVSEILARYAMRSVNKLATEDGSSVTLRIAVPIKSKYEVLRAVREAGATDPMIQSIRFLG